MFESLSPFFSVLGALTFWLLCGWIGQRMINAAEYLKLRSWTRHRPVYFSSKTIVLGGFSLFVGTCLLLVMALWRNWGTSEDSYR